MAVIRPSARRIGADKVAQPLTPFDIERVLVRTKLAVAIFELAPQPVQMNRMLHHRVVDQNEPHSLSELQFNRLSAGEFHSVESPDKSLHVAGQMNFDLATRRPRIDATIACAQIGVIQY